MPGKKGKKGKKEKEPSDFGLSADGMPAVRGPEDIVRLLKERTLMDRVSQLEFANKHLRSRNDDLKSGLEETTAEQSDVYVYLHKKLDENFSVIASLEEKLEDLEDENERLKKIAKKEIAAASATYESKLSDANREISRLSEELLALEEFRAQRETVQAETERLREALEQEKKDRQLEVAELERRGVAAKERLKKEMFARIKETKKSILAATGDQLHHTTRRTMAENEQITTELTYQSKETEKVMDMNKRLLSQNGDLRRNLKLLEQAQEELVKRTHFFQKLVKKLHEKVKLGEEREKVLKDAGTEGVSRHRLVEMEQLIVSLHRQVSQLSEERNATGEENEALRSQVADLEAAAKHRESLQDDTLKFLLSAVNDLREQAAKSVTAEGGLHSLSRPEKAKVLDSLLSRMQLYESVISSNPYRAGGGAPGATRGSSRGSLGSSSSGVAGAATSFPPIGVSIAGRTSTSGGGPRHSPSADTVESRPPSVPQSGMLPVDRSASLRRGLPTSTKPLSSRGAPGATRRAAGPVSIARDPSARRPSPSDRRGPEDLSVSGGGFPESS